MNAEDIAELICDDLTRIGWLVRRLGPFLLIDVVEEGKPSQAFAMQITETVT
jgi:hypothetical protein